MAKEIFVFKAARISILAALFSLLSSFNTPVLNKDAVIVKVLKHTKELNKLAYELKNAERINGKILSGEQIIKYQTTPFNCYITMQSPNKGAALSYKSGENNNKAVYKPNNFPYVAMNLDPLGMLMRKNNHHTIFELGFNPIATILENAVKQKTYRISMIDHIVWDNTSCYHLILDAENTKIVNYKVNKNETLRSIAQDLLINEYRIIELNPSIANFDHKLIENEVIKVPAAYADKIELYISKSTFLPVFQQFKDANGVFARYEYKKVIINPDFDLKEFDILK